MKKLLAVLVALSWLPSVLFADLPRPEVREATVEVALFAVAVGFAYLSGYLARKRIPKSKAPDTILSQRGEYTSWVRGVDSVSAVFGWAGGRFSRREKVSSNDFSNATGSLFGGAKQRIYYEEGVHWLGVGPLDAIHAIYQNGVNILPSPLYRSAIPSGTRILLGDREGAFWVFWGEERQPKCGPGIGAPDLGAAERMGVSSRWPLMPYIYWEYKRLGTSPVWGQIQYVIEKRPVTTLLAPHETWHLPTNYIVFPLPGHAIIGANPGGPGVNYVEVAESYGHLFVEGRYAYLNGNGANPDGLHQIIRSDELVPPAVVSTRTRIYLDATFASLPVAGYVRDTNRFEDEGCNPAAIMADALFEPWPDGAALPTTMWDTASLLEVAETANDEELRFHASAAGVTVKEILEQVLTDMGCMVPLDTFTGLVKFVLQRTSAGPFPVIGPEVRANLTELEVDLSDRQPDRSIYAFNERSRRFKQVTIGLDAAGRAAYRSYHRAQQVDMPSVRDFTTAQKVALRRSLEALPGQAAYDVITAGRDTRSLQVGTTVEVDGKLVPQRILGITLLPNSSKVEVRVADDNYAKDPSGWSMQRPPGGENRIVERDLAAAIFEVPEFWAGAGQRLLAVLRIRAHNQVEYANIWDSSDDITYDQVIIDDGRVTGGTLVSDMLAAPFELNAEISILGPDIAGIEDLTGREEEWRRGKQIAVIGDEVFFVKRAVLVSGSTWRLEGLVRARYDTVAATHAAGTPVFVVPEEELFAWTDTAKQTPGATIYAKNQPFAGEAIALSSLSPISKVLYGKGVIPPPVSALAVYAPYKGVLGFKAGADIQFRWGYSTPQTPSTGAGWTPAGVAVAYPDPEGLFRVVIELTGGGGIVRDFTTPDPDFLYTAGDRVTETGGNVNFIIHVYQLRAGYQSSAVSQTITYLP